MKFEIYYLVTFILNTKHVVCLALSSHGDGGRITTIDAMNIWTGNDNSNINATTFNFVD